MSTCPDCKGTGKYIGLLKEEECQTCNSCGEICTNERRGCSPVLTLKSRSVKLEYPVDGDPLDLTMEVLHNIGPWTWAYSETWLDGKTDHQFDSVNGYQLSVYDSNLTKDEILELINV